MASSDTNEGQEIVIRALPTSRPIPWGHVATALYVAVNLSLTVILVRPLMGPDWGFWQMLSEGNPYRHDPIIWAWSPVALPFMEAILVIGYPAWAALHVVVVFLLRDRLLILLTLTSWAFWTDVAVGNTFAFVFVAGALALRGNRWSVIASFALVLLMPRPVQFPLVAWLIWQQRHLWGWFAGLFALHAVAVVLSGYAFDWASTMLAYGIEPEYDIGPTAWFGTAWLIVGIPLAAVLAWRGHVGWAGLAMTTYLLPQYLLMPLLEVVRPIKSLRETIGTPPLGHSSESQV